MNEENKNAKTVGIDPKKILFIVAVIVALITVNFGGIGSGKAEQAAEDKVKQNVYLNLGVVPVAFTSDVIYKSGDKRLIVVKYGLTSSDWDGSCCVYTSGNHAINTTQMMSAEYDFKEHIEECKALFGLS